MTDHSHKSPVFAGWSAADLDKLFLVLDLVGHPERIERVHEERRELMRLRDRVRELEALVKAKNDTIENMEWAHAEEREMRSMCDDQ